jgi:hypothetical protein
VSSRYHVLSSSLQYEGFNVDKEINNTMNGTPEDESDGYMCNISDDVNIDGILRRTFSDFMNERWNEEGNGKEEQK